MELSLSPDHEIYRIESLQTQARVDLLLGFQDKMNGMDAVIDSKKEIALMRLIGIGMSKINLLYIIQNAFIGLASTVLAFLSSRLCLMLMREYVATMGIVLDATRFYSFEAVIMTVIFVISVLPTVICTLIMSGKDGISE